MQAEFCDGNLWSLGTTVPCKPDIHRTDTNRLAKSNPSNKSTVSEKNPKEAANKPK
ncbi:hypothetical protein CRE_09406 [Caenorhabditis remanei]|uniref:Uncharacterized protein n=1 Tax=Caenorhabditis remanei TaxID=31234 RepID=E3LIP4_CAERE|nr:hypothetical protein CRE_09406 [Caenorhabditis remanei]